jgi:hypothetical protein
MWCRCGKGRGGAAAGASGRVVTRAGRAGGTGRVPRMLHVPTPSVLPNLTLGGRLSLHPDTGPAAAERCGASVLVVNLSSCPPLHHLDTPAPPFRLIDPVSVSIGLCLCAAGTCVSVCVCAPHSAPPTLCLHGTCGCASCRVAIYNVNV